MELRIGYRVVRIPVLISDSGKWRPWGLLVFDTMG